MVTHGHAGGAVEINIAEDTRHAEHVLTFEVAAVAPAEHLNGEAVFALVEILREVEFSYVVGALCIAHILSVEPNEGCGVDAAEVDEGALSVPVFGEVEGAHVGTHGVDAVVASAVVEARTSLDEGRRVGVGIFHVAVDGAVIALHFPVGGHGDGIP